VTNIEMQLRLNASAKLQDLITCENLKCIEVGVRLFTGECVNG
jgi:hypothetical protein